MANGVGQEEMSDDEEKGLLDDVPNEDRLLVMSATTLHGAAFSRP